MNYFRLDIAYDGSRFLGSATQPHQNTVQDALSKACARLGIFAPPIMASRTDKGVHATHNVCRIELEHDFKDLEWLRARLCSYLDGRIVIRRILRVDSAFNPRFDARLRQYRYILCHGALTPFSSQYFTYYPRVDIRRLDTLVRGFVGTHDFSHFCLSNDSASNVRTIYRARAYTRGEFSVVCFEANGFLRGQIRYMMGFLLRALDRGLGLDELALQRDGKAMFSHTLAPPNGLYLSKILY